MADPNSDEWLPPDCTVEVGVRKNGKRDKVLEVVVEKGIAEGLPPGWMKKPRITTKGDTIRRHSCYIDPVSGYAFRFIKDVDRYLESGEIGRNAFKPKDIESSDMELEDDKFSSAGVTTKPTLSVSMGQRSNLDAIVNDQEIPKPACAGESMPTSISEYISSVVGTELTSSVLSRAQCTDQKGKVGLAESALFPGCTDGATPEKHLRESAQTKHETEKVQNGQRKYKDKKKINLPRRASKRLAGIKVDPVPELKTRNRARRVAVRQSREEEAITNEDKSPSCLPNGAAKEFDSLEGGSETNYKIDSATNTMLSPWSDQSKHSYGKLSTPERLPEKTVEEHGSNKDQECFSFLPMENHATVKDWGRVLENGDKVDAKSDYSLDLPLGELLTDPCVAFAIQTLTGVTFDTSNQISSELKNTEHSETLAAAEWHGKKIKGLNMGDPNGACNMLSPPEDFAIPEGHAGDAEIDDIANGNSGSSSEMPLDISWMDPCIEFAVKTLTGTIPLDTDPNAENCLQQQFSSSNTQGHCEMAL